MPKFTAITEVACRYGDDDRMVKTIATKTPEDALRKAYEMISPKPKRNEYNDVEDYRVELEDYERNFQDAFEYVEKLASNVWQIVYDDFSIIAVKVAK